MRVAVTYTAALILAAASLASAANPQPGALWKSKAADPEVSEQMRLFLPEWAPQEPAPGNEEVASSDDALQMATRSEMYPLIPLPPALHSIAALGGCAVALRAYRRIRIQLRAD